MVSWRKQLILAGSLFALGTLAYWLEYAHKPKKEAAEEQAKKLFQVKDTPIESVTLNDGRRTFALKCSDVAAKLCKPGDNSKWELTQPAKVKADDSNTNALVSALNNLTTSDTIDLKEETAEKRAALLKEYGLDPAARGGSSVKRLTVATSGGETTVYLGQVHPIGESIFALAETKKAGQEKGQPDENKVYLIPNYFKSNFEHDLTYWRDKKLLTLGSHEIDGFKLESSKGTVSGERKAGAWTLHAAGGDYPGDSENVESLLSGATFLMAKTFVSDDKSDKKARSALAGQPVALTLTLQKEKGTAKEAPAPITLKLFQKKGGAKNGKLYATVSSLDPLFELEPTATDRIDKTLKDLRLSKLITSMERFSVKRVEVSGKPVGTAALSFANEDGKWVQMPGKKAISGDRVSAMLDKLSGNRIQDFIQGAAIPKGEPDGIRLVLSDEKGEKKREIAIWKTGEKLVARDLASPRKEAYVLDTALVADLPWEPDFFTPKPAAPPSPPAGKAK